MSISSFLLPDLILKCGHFLLFEIDRDDNKNELTSR